MVQTAGAGFHHDDGNCCLVLEELLKEELGSSPAADIKQLLRQS
ncbi:hypothetical protein MKY66_04180 [Paenibacillus sp. FSL R5-0766]|nr:hypothetical protein [Paenibacillus sp. FSL R5-0765]